MFRYLITILFFLSFVTEGATQQFTITGRVTDVDTKEGLPFCNVYLFGTTTGVATDFDGYYTLALEELPTVKLIASTIGYSDIGKPVTSAIDQEINFKLSAAGVTFNEVVVIAGENPANQIVRDIIENKKNNRVDQKKTFQAEAYTKVEIDFENIEEELLNNKLFKPFAFILENIDSTSDEKPFLPVYLTESIEDIFHVKGEPEKRVLKARKVSGVNNETVVDLINRIQEDLSVYDNWISILEKQFASPFSNLGLHYYEYYIMDSTYIQDKWAYKLKFKPKRKQENTFYGNFWVADSSFAIIKVDMRMSEDVNINLIKRIILFQEFEMNEQEVWLPKKKKMLADFVAFKKAPGMIGRKTSSYRNWKLEDERLITEYEEKTVEPNFYNTEGLTKDADYWEEARHEELSDNESGVYKMIDSIKNVPIYKTYVDVIVTLVGGYKEFGPVEVGPYFSLYSQNPVEGHRFKCGIWTSRHYSKRLRYGGYLAYGLKDKKVKYGLDLQWVLRRFPRTVIGGGYKDDINLNAESSEEIGEGNLFSGIYRRKIVQKLVHVNEAKLFYEQYWNSNWSNRITLLSRKIDPYGNIYDNGGGFNFAYLKKDDNLLDTDTIVNSTEIVLTARYAYKERFVEGNYTRTSLGSKYPILEFQYTAGLKGVLEGDYNYHKLSIALRHYVYLNPIGWTSYRIKAGKVFGRVPFLLMEVFPGNETYFLISQAYNGINRYEFASDSYASLKIQHHFDGFFFNKVPLLRKLEWRAIASFKAIIGSLSEENRKANILNTFDPNSTDSYTGFRAPSKRPYMEAGIGIENIFKIFRVDAIWRLTYLDNPEAAPLTVRLGISFYL